MNYHKDLGTQLLSVCDLFFKKHNFSVASDNGTELIMENAFCKLKFKTNNYREFVAQYLPGKVDYFFGLNEIIDFSFPAEQRKIFHTIFYKSLVKNKEFALMTKMMLDFLDANRPGIFTNDASWTRQLMVDLELQRSQVDFLFKKFFHGHPIKKQYYEGNPCWRSNLEAYLKENKINIGSSTIVRSTTHLNSWVKFVDAFRRRRKPTYAKALKGAV
jgi:hypothetical protein